MLLPGESRHNLFDFACCNLYPVPVYHPSVTSHQPPLCHLGQSRALAKSLVAGHRLFAQVVQLF